MAGGGGQLEYHNGFSLDGWGESHGDKVESLTWSVQADPQVDEENRPGCTFLIFDAQKKTLFIDIKAAQKAGVKITASLGLVVNILNDKLSDDQS